MICVLNIVNGPATGKRIWVKENQCIEIGRVASADLPIPSDSHLSRRHLLIDSTENLFRVRDVGSANGTYINNKRITVHTLSHGDTIKAGTTVFSVSFLKDGENPHKDEGISFGKTIFDDNSFEDNQRDPESGIGSRTFQWDIEQTMRFTAEELGTHLGAARLENASIAKSRKAEMGSGSQAATSKPNHDMPSHDIEVRENEHELISTGTVCEISLGKLNTPSSSNASSDPLKSQSSLAALALDSLKPVDAESKQPFCELSSHALDDSGFPSAEWLKSFARKRPNSVVYEVAPNGPPAREAYRSVVLDSSPNYLLSTIFNLSQLPAEVIDEVRDLVEAGTEVFALSRTVVAARLDRNSQTWRLLSQCVGHDAIICILSEEQIPPDKLLEAANSLGYPSLFASHMTQPDAPILRLIYKQKLVVIFEENKGGQLLFVVPSKEFES